MITHPLSFPANFQGLNTLIHSASYGIEPGTAEEKQQLRELCDEVIMLAGLNHENVLGLRGVVFSEDRDLPRYIMTEMADHNLESWLADPTTSKPLPWDLVLEVWRQLSAGLSYLHSQSPPIVHRDLKPENILVFKRGTVLSFRVADFGLATFLRSRSVTEAGYYRCGSAGNAFYQAPEVHISDVGHTVSADVYSLTAIMVEVIFRHVMLRPTPLDGTDFRLYLPEVSEFLASRGRHDVNAMIKACCDLMPYKRLSASECLNRLKFLCNHVDPVSWSTVNPV
jgi:serine/threonine protein kinase